MLGQHWPHLITTLICWLMEKSLFVTREYHVWYIIKCLKLPIECTPVVHAVAERRLRRVFAHAATPKTKSAAAWKLYFDNFEISSIGKIKLISWHHAILSGRTLIMQLHGNPSDQSCINMSDVISYDKRGTWNFTSYCAMRIVAWLGIFLTIHVKINQP